MEIFIRKVLVKESAAGPGQLLFSRVPAPYGRKVSLVVMFGDRLRTTSYI